MIIDIDDILVTSDLFTEPFSCALAACHGLCCVEGTAGAPITSEEIASLETAATTLWPQLSPAARSVIRCQGVAYCDRDGDLVTSIIGAGACVFASFTPPSSVATAATPCCLCLIEHAQRTQHPSLAKPISCALYPLRERTLANGRVSLTYERLALCAPAREKGRQQAVTLYSFLRPALLRRFGSSWVAAADAMAQYIAQRQ